MRRTGARSVGDILREAIEQSDLEEGLAERRAAAAWPRVVGPVVAGRTSAAGVRRGVLSVRVGSAPLRQELSMNRSRLTAAINAAVGRDVLRDIRFVSESAQTSL